MRNLNKNIKELKIIDLNILIVNFVINQYKKIKSKDIKKVNIVYLID